MTAVTVIAPRDEEDRTEDGRELPKVLLSVSSSCDTLSGETWEADMETKFAGQFWFVRIEVQVGSGLALGQLDVMLTRVLSTGTSIPPGCCVGVEEGRPGEDAA